jgi:hypothetical protein
MKNVYGSKQWNDQRFLSDNGYSLRKYKHNGY